MAHVFTLLPGRDALDTGQGCKGPIAALVYSSLQMEQPLLSGAPCLKAAESFVIWRKDWKKPGPFRDVMALRPGTEGRSVDRIDLWGQRLGT